MHHTALYVYRSFLALSAQLGKINLNARQTVYCRLCIFDYYFKYTLPLKELAA